MSALLKKLTTANSHRVSSTTNQPIRTQFKALKVRYSTQLKATAPCCKPFITLG